jgi:hypothetical protein
MNQAFAWTENFNVSRQTSGVCWIEPHIYLMEILVHIFSQSLSVSCIFFLQQNRTSCQLISQPLKFSYIFFSFIKNPNLFILKPLAFNFFSIVELMLVHFHHWNTNWQSQTCFRQTYRIRYILCIRHALLGTIVKKKNNWRTVASSLVLPSFARANE